MNNLMIDLETLASTSNAAIIQIGACYFDWDGNVGEKFLVNTVPPEGFEISIDTVIWWFGNKDQVIKSLIPNRVPLAIAIEELRQFAKCAEHIWSHATFDFALIMNAAERLRVKKPFGYRTTRDIRTLMHLSEYVETEGTERTDDHHNALADCIYQVGYCTKAFKKLKGVL